MRNLKRVLALAMAMVMILGMMVIGSSAASYTDESAIDAKYAEAVEVLTDMGVFRGTGAGFAPKAILSRAEAAALIYRVISADVEDDKISLYSYSSFADVAEGAWYTPYVTYAANGGYILGYDGNFMPNDSVTGIQVLAIMLRAMGYGQKGEFEGAGWKDGVLTVADDLKLLEKVAQDDLDKPASRELVAQLLWDSLWAPTTTYTPAFGYWASTVTLGVKKFELAKVTGISDEWGRPGYAYTYATGEEETEFTYAPTKTYTTAVTECQVSTDTKVATSKDYVTFTNGAINAGTDKIVATNTVDTIGAQGRITEVYKTQGIIVYIDTLLAKVDDVKPATYDFAGHLKTPSSITLTVYDGTTTQVTLTNGKTNYEYARNDMVLVNAVQTAAEVVRTDALYKHVEILGVAEAFTGAQTYVWWWADKHTVNGTEYMDNYRFELDAAGITLGANYTWYLDQFGNLIGDTAIVTPKAYAIVEGVQWINTWGVNGYAQANIRYMDNTTDTVIVKDVYTVAAPTTAVSMRYADYHTDLTLVSTTNPDGGADFKEGEISTVWQYNDDCMNDLYEVVANIDGTVSLKEQTEADPANVQDGVSAVTDDATPVANVKFYTDNYTVYMIRTQNPITKAYTYSVVTGYDALENDWTGADVEVDYVLNYDALNRPTYAKYVYITGTADTARAKTAEEFIYFTGLTNYYGDAMQNNVPCFVVGGVVDTEGNTDVIYVAKDAGDLDTAADTMADLHAFLAGAKDKLYLVKTTNGIVTDLSTGLVLVDTSAVAADETVQQVKGEDNTYATFSNKGTFSTVDGNGVIKIQNLTDPILDAINVNASTTIINEGGKGTITDLNNAVLAGKSIYVVASFDANGNKTTQAVAIFITGTDTTPISTAVAKVLSAGNGRTYEFDTLPAAVAAASAGDVITLVKDVALTAQLNLPNAITLDGAGHKITASGYKTADATTNGGILISAAGTTIKNLTVVGPNTNIGWDNGEYGIKVYAAATLENVSVNNANAGIQVAANTTLKGTINVSGNEFGGIEVKSGAVMTIATGAVIVNTTETSTLPTAWMDTEFAGTITGGSLISKLVSPKVYYYVNVANTL